MVPKIIKKITFLSDLVTQTLFKYKNTSDVDAMFTLCTANIIEGKLGCAYSKQGEGISYICTYKEGRYILECWSDECDGSYCPDNYVYNCSTPGYGMIGGSILLKEGYHSYTIETPNITHLIVKISPGDTVNIKGSIREEYITIEVPEGERNAVYENDDNPWISYRLIGKDTTQRDDTIAFNIFAAATRFFTEDERGITWIHPDPESPNTRPMKFIEPTPEFYQRFIKKVNEITLADIYPQFVKSINITQEDIDRIRPMIQWWKIDKLAYDPYLEEIIWIEPFS